ncbi:MAG: hypothetical protein V4572_09840 [Bacteroidota bacterium]
MFNITLIGTIHSENGRCNPSELYKILEDIKPNVIFDELPSHFADLFYSESFDIAYENNILNKRPMPNLPLEVKCIKKYRQNHNVKIVSVDIDISQDLAEQKEEVYFLFNTFFKYEEYKNVDNKKEALIAKEGFHFINSNKFLQLIEKKELLERKIMESEIHKHRLLTAYSTHKKQNDNREKVMLDNIYKYSNENQYIEAVFLIGAEHKKSIMQKIIKYEKLSEIKLNWKIFSNE